MRKILLFLCIPVLAGFFSGCSDDKEGPKLASAKEITAFYFKAAVPNPPELTAQANGEIDQTNRTIKVVVPANVPVNALIPTITYSRTAQGISPNPGRAYDFSSPVEFTVTAEDNTTATYTVTVIATDEPALTSLKINGTPAILSEQTFYYPVKLNAQNPLQNTVALEGTGMGKITIGDTPVELTNGQAAVSFPTFAAKNTFAVKVTNLNNKTAEYTLVLTGLPIAAVDIDGGVDAIPDDPKATCTFTLIDPEARTRMGTDQNIVHFVHRAGIERRGAYSQRFEKKSYSIEIRDDADEEADASFFGLREDGDWILDAMWVDHGRMRNRLCTDIWNTMNKPYYFDKEPEAVNGTRGKFVELFINGEYRGLYCMTEKIDRKQLKLKKDVNTGGVMFKGDSFTNTTLFRNAEGPIDNNQDTWYGFEAEHPAEPGNMRWETIEELVKFISPQDNPDDVLFAADLDKHLDVNNLIDYLLMVNATCSHDNFGKNIFWSIYNTKNGDNRFFCTPWDMDGSFGRNSDSGLMEGEGFLGFGLNSIAYNEDELYHRLYDVNPNNFLANLKNRWNTLKTNQLSPAAVSEMINAYKTLFNESGAYEREMKRWEGDPEFRCTPIDEEAAYMIEWYGRHYTLIDNFINTL